jgi:DNA polymerase-4
MQNLDFNPHPANVMHLDLNSCFATVEQQANPHLRGKPIAVAAYVSPNGCILAPSIEAKRYGIKTGMRVAEGKLLYPGLIVLPCDPAKYRNIHLRLRKLLCRYSWDVTPKSIDEFVLEFKGSGRLPMIAQEIKQRIKAEIGEWLTVSIGIAPNRFLAKVASGLHKPDGLDLIDKSNFLDVYASLGLTQLPYIKTRNAVRLNSMGIFSVVDFYTSPLWKLKAAFASINSYYWYLRLRGWEIDATEFARRSYGNSYALPASPHASQGGPKPYINLSDLSPILSKLCEKMGFRLRRAGYCARGIHLAVGYRDGSFWHKGVSYPESFFDTREIYKSALKILALSPYKKPVRDLAVSCFNLKKGDELQLSLFEDVLKKESLVKAVDKVNERWGSYILAPARMLTASDAVPDRIAFGSVKELEEFTLR